MEGEFKERKKEQTRYECGGNGCKYFLKKKYVQNMVSAKNLKIKPREK